MANLLCPAKGAVRQNKSCAPCSLKGENPMHKTRLASMLAVMGGLTIATSACSKQGDSPTEAPAGAAMADQAASSDAAKPCAAASCAAKPCAAKPCAAKKCGAKPCAPKGCAAKPCAAKP